MPKKDKTTNLYSKWETESNEEIVVHNPDGTQFLLYTDGTKEMIDKDHLRYNHWMVRTP